MSSFIILFHSLCVVCIASFWLSHQLWMHSNTIQQYDHQMFLIHKYFIYVVVAAAMRRLEYPNLKPSIAETAASKLLQIAQFVLNGKNCRSPRLVELHSMQSKYYVSFTPKWWRRQHRTDGNKKYSADHNRKIVEQLQANKIYYSKNIVSSS